MTYLFRMELLRSLAQMRRYPVETILSFAILAGMFFGIAYGTSAALGSRGPAVAGATLSVLSFIAWMLCMGLLSGPASEVEAESNSGTIEQLFTSGHGFTRILLVRMAASVLVSSVIVAVIALIAGRVATLQPSALAGLALLPALLTAAGGGLALAGIALVLKKVRAIVLLVTFGLMPVMMSDGVATWVGEAPALLAVPFVGPMGLAKAAVIDPAGWQWSGFGTAVLAAIGYFGLGWWMHRRMWRVAMRRGAIGQY